ncbi:hypothetical protein OF829_12690 [Sphingomonas sp. LB-2]|uniref:hypothetical protein n=1 Tax=Sphingomonas caeni TaxID=2984949 RepID=UPI0022318538|nr:hypothetical protein [Sphingomonas caeni]MCW3848100.1 hypothetical protein [Sphingomonas caeni]
MPETVAQALKRVGPCLTSDLIREFVAAGMAEPAARKKIARAQSEYTRLAGLRFAKNARFIYLDSQFGGPKFWEALERAFYSAGKSYWTAIIGMKARGGLCLKENFPIVSGAPQARKGQMSPERILERLTSIQFLKVAPNDEGKPPLVAIVPYGYHTKTEAEFNAVMLAEFVTLQAVKEWARRFGLGSFNKFAMRGDDELPLVSGIAWDMAAPSYVRPLMRVIGGKAKPGFFVCDINLVDVITKDYVEAFVRKHDMASAPMNVAPIMPALVGQVFAEDAFSLAKQKGILALTTENMFGSDVARALRELIALLCDLGARAAVDPSKIETVINALTKIEGSAGNVRGALFEVVIGSLVKDVDDGYLKIGEKRFDAETGRKAEIDVQLDRGQEHGVLVVECKAKIPGARVSLEEVQKWHGDRVPLIYKILSSDGAYTDKHFRFEIWSNGPFNDDAVAWLSGQTLDFGVFSMGWRDGEAVKEYADKAKQPALRKILREHYFQHPLSRVARQLREESKKPESKLLEQGNLL